MRWPWREARERPRLRGTVVQDSFIASPTAGDVVPDTFPLLT
jgi:hypothetical protein